MPISRFIKAYMMRGSGTGLGMAVVCGTINDHDGFITNMNPAIMDVHIRRCYLRQASRFSSHRERLVKAK
jgi:hypothetical protein